MLAIISLLVDIANTCTKIRTCHVTLYEIKHVEELCLHQNQHCHLGLIIPKRGSYDHYIM